ncbi:MAG: UDP-N-acetylglucosamine 1-carboxyvinyltransferase, partial [Actinobacteria bacterium]|nr:UDP-N-acetylglucosamine 1-carboxyvinyltransferase [Actinomycetota bacterium]
DSPSVLKDVPKISDVEVVARLLELHGVSINFDDKGVMELDPRGVKQARMVDIDAHAGSSRIPILFCGPLLHQLGEAFIPDLGGCHIGDRPVDFHLDVLRNFGAVIEKSQNGTRLTAPNGLHGAKLSLPYPSVGATEQVLLTSVRAKGLTELSGAAIEPEIMDLIAILQKMGAIISVDTDRTIRIEGVETLNGYTHRALFDRNEAASWAAAALTTGGDIFVGGARQIEMTTFLNVFRKVGGGFDIEDDGIRFYQKGADLHPVVIETDVHPGFMTDWQQPLVVALTQAKGLSIVHETVYENRFGFTDALVKMGAQIQIYRECLGGNPCRFGQMNFYHSAVISGPSELKGADIVVPDLRGGFSHMVAALTAKGVSNVSNAQLISRGYEHFLQKLSDLGADFSYSE